MQVFSASPIPASFSLPRLLPSLAHRLILQAFMDAFSWLTSSYLSCSHQANGPVLRSSLGVPLPHLP
jgi:hypothetical protein